MRILATILSAGLATGAAAQEVCPHVPVITDLATFILDNRADLRPLRQARYGDTAAFMMMRYGGADSAAVMGDLARSDVRAPRLYDDLRGAYDLTQPGGLEAWQDITPERLDAFVGMLPSTRRALILADEGATYFRLLDAALADKRTKDSAQMINNYSQSVVTAVSDQPEEFLMTLASRAEEAGHLWIAGGLLGDLTDRTAFEAFMVRHGTADYFEGIEPDVMLGYSMIGVLRGETPLRAPQVGYPERTLNDLMVFNIYRASLAGQPLDYLNVYFHQSGEIENSNMAALSLINAVSAGEVDPVRDPEAAWLLLYRSLLENGDVVEVQRTLSTIDWPSQSIRHYSGRAVESLDVMLAKEAFGPLMRGETVQVPQVAEYYTGLIPWEDWQAAAATQIDDLPANLVPLAVELLWESGAYDAAADVGMTKLDINAAMAFARDGLARLDRACDEHIVMPGGAVRLGGMAVYKFE